MCIMVSSVVALLGALPAWISRFLVKNSVGKAWTSSANDALCTHLLQVEFCFFENGFSDSTYNIVV